MLFDPKKFQPYVAPAESPLIESLKRARTMVADKWCRGACTDREGGVCSVVAISRATCNLHDDFLAGRAKSALGLMRRVIGGGDLIDWNDRPDRTQAEVVAAFDRAIELARSEA